ncbi:MAG: hypothetical protein CSA65_08700 [Proteobacteria bacterium]|nr:MAG: hypothetical protein CSB49_07090 [Pseudomonadota bacterium]PIE17535.1 MAG: hypothetical protein CSA65_08700 [Pseudomonadota bacterium]
MTRAPHYAYYVPSENIEQDRIREVLHAIGLDQAWVRILPAEAKYEDHSLIQIEIYDLAEGVPIFAEEIGPTLSQAAGLSLVVGIDESDDEAALMLCQNGEQAFAWAGSQQEFEARDEEGTELKGPEGFRHVFKDLIGHTFEGFLEACPRNDEAREVADEHTDLLLRGRFMGLPEGFPRIADLFLFHEEDDDEDEAADGDNKNEAEQDRVALVLLDLRLTEVLWKESTAQEVSKFLEAIEPLKGKVLGPLARDLEEAKDWVRTQPPARPLEQAPAPDLTTFEVLAMATALSFSGGTSTQRFDERLLPLLSLGDSQISGSIIKDSLNDIEHLGILSAMAEVLPYSVPEGELLECFADEELRPLADWAVKGNHYEGSLLRVDIKRVAELLQELDVDTLRAKAEAFGRAWFEVSPGSVTSYEAWQAVRPQDKEEWDRLLIQVGELRLVLSLLGVNNLEPALLFYGT